MITLTLSGHYVDRQRRVHFIYDISGDEASLVALRARACTFGRFYSPGEKKAFLDGKLYASERTYERWGNRAELPVSAFWPFRPRS